MRTLFAFLLLMGSLNAGELESQCEKTFSEFLQTLKEKSHKLTDRFFYDPIAKDLVRMEGCRDYRKMYSQESVLRVIKLRELFEKTAVQKVIVTGHKNGRVDAVVILKRKDGWTKHEAIFLRNGADIAVYCKDSPVSCDEEGN